jgi:predicted nucleic acid-binding protein
LPLVGATGDIFGSLAAAIKAAGGSIGIVCKIYGLQALQHGFGLLTRNRRDFQDIPGLNPTLYVLAEQKRG